MERFDTEKALLVFGSNIGPDFGPKEARECPDHLSMFSKFNMLAAGFLYQAEPLTIIIPTYKTAGDDIPSEGQAMYAYSRNYFDIQNKHLILGTDPDALSSRGDLLSGVVLALGAGIKPENLAILSFGAHAKNILKIGKNCGISIPHNNVLFTERVIYNVFQNNYSKKYADQFMWGFRKYEITSGKLLREIERSILLNTIDKRGQILHEVAKNQRA